MVIVVAPDKFKRTLSARAVARAMADGAAAARPDAEIGLVPMADGGEGSLEVLQSSVETVHIDEIEVAGPLGSWVQAPVARLGDGRAAFESAAASGLQFVTGSNADALAATTRGTGELLAAALSSRPASVVVFVGGTATTDGGTGAATALGWRFLDRRGRPLPPGGGALADLARIDPDSAVRPPAGLVVGAYDVTNTVTGPRGSARVFAPQKGADAAAVERLEIGLEVLAERIRLDLGSDVTRLVGGGAGGGLAAGLATFVSAVLRPAFDVLAAAAHLRGAVAGADLVLTGEGRIDESTAEGKVVAGVAALAGDAGVPCAAVAGEIALAPGGMKTLGLSGWEEAGPRPGPADPDGIAAAAARLVEVLLPK